MTRTFWQPPRLRRDEDHEAGRGATWLELFYDLVFVAAIAQLARYFSSNLDWTGFATYIAFFVPIWVCWLGATFYATRFDTDDLSDRLASLFEMAIVAAMAVQVNSGLTDASGEFAICYILFRILLILQNLNAGYHVPEVRGLTTTYALGFGTGAVFWLISLAVPLPWRVGFWAVGIVIDLATPFMASRWVTQFPPSMTHLPERFGLFTIIVLGESIIAVVKGLSEHDWGVLSIVAAFLGLSVAFSLWWLYFDSVDGSPLQRIKEGNVAIAMGWVYAHLPLAICLTTMGVGVEQMVSNGVQVVPSLTDRWLFCGSVSICLCLLGAIHRVTWTLGNPHVWRIVGTYRLGSAAFVGGLAIASTALSSLTLIILVAIACGVQVGLDLRQTFSQL
jgi:low temperature requirement protein LtrA